MPKKKRSEIFRPKSKWKAKKKQSKVEVDDAASTPADHDYCVSIYDLSSTGSM